MEKYLTNFILFSILLFPLIIGAVVYFLKVQKAVAWIETLNKWLLNKKTNVAEKTGFVSKWFFRPLLWGLSKIMDSTEQIKDQNLRTAIRISLYLYFSGLLTYISLSIVVAIVIVVIVLWILSEVLGDKESSYRESSVSSRVKDKKIYDTRGFFKKKVAEVDEKGNIYDTKGFFKLKVGRVDDDGKIHDSKGFFDKQVGKIDGDGNIFDSTGFIDKKVAKIDEDGKIKDTTGFFEKETGEAK